MIRYPLWHTFDADIRRTGQTDHAAASNPRYMLACVATTGGAWVLRCYRRERKPSSVYVIPHVLQHTLYERQHQWSKQSTAGNVLRRLTDPLPQKKTDRRDAQGVCEFRSIEKGWHAVRFCTHTGNQSAASSLASTRDLYITRRASLSEATNSSTDVSAACRPNTTRTRSDNAPRRLALEHYASLMDTTRRSHFESGQAWQDML